MERITNATWLVADAVFQDHVAFSKETQQKLDAALRFQAEAVDQSAAALNASLSKAANVRDAALRDAALVRDKLIAKAVASVKDSTLVVEKSCQVQLETVKDEKALAQRVRKTLASIQVRY